MPVSKQDNGRYQARFQHQNARHKKNFKTAREAKAWIADSLAKLEAGESPVLKPDKRTLKELAQAWYDFHGHSLKTGTSRLKDLERSADQMGNPNAQRFKAGDFARFRADRIDNHNNKPDSVNHLHAYWLAVFNELIRLKEWRHQNPFKHIKKLKVDEVELTFLSLGEIDRLILACRDSNNPQLVAVVELCLQTGARWGEALNLTWSRVQKDRVTYTGTKSGKNRTIPISVELFNLLKATGRRHGPMFGNCDQAFSNAIDRAKIILPKGQATHVLRHTFASHFVMNSGDLLTLQKILGHSSLDMVLRYAHLAPEHLEKAVQFNPRAPKSSTTVAPEKENGPETAQSDETAPILELVN